MVLIALNRAAAFGQAARWLLHDIRSPAQSLTLLGDLLDHPHADIAETLRDASRQLSRALELLSRVVHPTSSLEPGPVSVRDSIEFVVALYRHAGGRIGTEIEVERGLPPAVGVERHLEHALLNLVLNAAAAMHDRPDGRIHIAGRTADDRIEVAVADTGPGVPAGLAERLFTRDLLQWSGSRLSGAGLLVAHEMLRATGGTIELARDGGTGATFVITLPVWRRLPPGGP